MSYLPIENYGVIGDLHTVALVGQNGSIDWYCFPHFDSPSVFGAILDDQKGGRYQIEPLQETINCKQMYLPDTNVLVTRFQSSEGIAELTDFMTIESDTNLTWNHRLIRQVEVIHGTLRFRMACQPAFNYARTPHVTEQNQCGITFSTDDLTLGLYATVDLKIKENCAEAEFTLAAGEKAAFLLERLGDNSYCEKNVYEREITQDFQETVSYWRKWLRRCTYQGRWREMINRSALVLKLLTFAPSGAIVAAPTTSLPEAMGGGRNWDYRYTWIRDASFTCYALLRLGFDYEAERFMSWIEDRCVKSGPDGGMQIMYRIDGSTEIKEETLDHLSGYCNSRPVRIGNAAHEQLQLDIYGELMDAAYLYNKHAKPISYKMWTHLRDLMDWLAKNWQKPDDGLWEVRSGKQPFVFSRLMTWVAMDRAIRIATQRGLPAKTEKWKEIRDAAYEEVMAKGWSEKRKAFVQYYGSETLDASNLLMPLVKFTAPNDPRMLSTLEQIQKELTYDALVYRYDLGGGAKDGLEGDEGTFSMCSFWLVEALTRAGKLDEARLKLEKMFTYANHLGMYSEEISTSGEMLGNYPQAFTHLALISAAYNLDKALNNRNLSRDQ